MCVTMGLVTLALTVYDAGSEEAVRVQMFTAGVVAVDGSDRYCLEVHPVKVLNVGGTPDVVPPANANNTRRSPSW